MNVNNNGVILSFDDSKLGTRNVSKVDTLYIHTRDGNGDAVSLHAYHKSLGWSGAAYNGYIEKIGRFSLLRPVQYIPAGVEGKNTTSVHICFEGFGDFEPLTVAQLVAAKYAIDYFKMMCPNLKRCIGHYEDSPFNPTACPGDAVINNNLQSIKDLFYGGNIMSSVANKSIVYGEKSDRVKTLQKLIVILQYSIDVDGAFGDQTQRALLTIQKNLGVIQSGIGDTNTVSAILNEIKRVMGV